MFSFLIVCSVAPASAISPTPPEPAVVEIERLEKLDKRVKVDGFTAAFRGRKLCVAIRHVRGIGRARLRLKHLPPLLPTTRSSVSSTSFSSSSSSSSCVQVEVRFLNFTMLEGFTVGSGGGEIYSLPAARAKQRKFLVKVPLSSNSATIDLAWVDAYRN